MFDRTTKWLETKWVTPAYAGWLLMTLTLCFFGVATNTMAGWLYVLSGVGIALLGVAAILPPRSLQSLTISRLPIIPVTAGAELEIALTIHNPTPHQQSLFQVQDLAPFRPLQPPITAVDTIAPQSEYQWVYRQSTEQRGVYQWEQIALRSGAPIGLFWCQRYRQASAIAYVYPQVLKLAQCPLIDGIGSRDRPSQRQFTGNVELATEGITRSLRPYRYGDPLRSIHWRTSARYGQFQVRELEIDRGGQDLIIYLDSGNDWDPVHFEQAVVAACSLYFYAHQFAHLNVKLWTAGTGVISGERQVLETLAAVQMNESADRDLPSTALIYLTSQSQQLDRLPSGSRWALWTTDRVLPHSSVPGIVIDPHKSLPLQLSSANFATNRSSIPDLQTPINSPNPHLN